MAIRNPDNVPRGSKAVPILRSQILEAQRHTNSNASAARWLNVSYERYRKYAKLYDLFDQHMNQEGIGVDKGMSKRPTSIPLKEILAGNHPDYSIAKLKNRLIARKKLIEECACCGFNEKRITDGRVPLMIRFTDGNNKNFSLTNLQLYCYNCMFLTTGAPSVVYRTSHIEKSFTQPHTIPKKHTTPMTVADHYDPQDRDNLEDISIELTEEERQHLYNDDT